MKKDKYIQISSRDLVYLLHNFEFMKFYSYNLFRKTLLPYLGFKTSDDWCRLNIQNLSRFSTCSGSYYNNIQIKQYLEADEKANYAYQLLEKAKTISNFFVVADDIKTKGKISLYSRYVLEPSMHQEFITYCGYDMKEIEGELLRFGCLDENKTLKIKKYECLYTLVEVLADFYTNIISQDINNGSFLTNIREIKGFSLPTPAYFNEAKMQSILENKNNSNKVAVLFGNNRKALNKYLNTSLDSYDFSNINFDGKNISNLKIRNNPTIKINFDKIEKDISNCDFNGYDLRKVIFRDFNIKDADFRNTFATIDLATCILSTEGKMNTGTLFDEENQFLFNDKTLSLEEVENLGIKIYKKEM